MGLVASEALAVCVAATAGGGESEARAAISCALMSPTRTADVSDLK